VRCDRPELWVPAGRNLRAVGVLVHRTRARARLPSRVVGGLRLTTPERTLIDLAGTVDDETLEIALEHARLAGLVTLESMRRALAAEPTRGRRGAGTLATMVDEVSGVPAQRALEVKVARILRASGLPAPERQHPVSAGGRTYHLDFAWAHRRVALECDGRRFHSDHRAFGRDRTRWTEIGAAAGFRILFATWFDATQRPTWIVEQVARALCDAA
jgi:very-short-patch-repair endonuclease